MERIIAPSQRSGVPTFEEFRAIQKRVAARLAREAIDGMMGEALKAKEERRYVRYPLEMLEWCRLDLEQFMKRYDPKQQEIDTKGFESYCKSEGWQVDEHLAHARSLYFEQMELFDRIERAEDSVYKEYWTSPQRARNAEEREAMELVMAQVLRVRNLKQWIADERLSKGQEEG